MRHYSDFEEFQHDECGGLVVDVEGAIRLMVMRESERDTALQQLEEARAECERLERARASWEADALVFAKNAEHAKERLAAVATARAEAVDACRETVRRANAIHDRTHEHEQRGKPDALLHAHTHDFLHYCIGASHEGEESGPRAVIGKAGAR
jgi:hypothetical protein